MCVCVCVCARACVCDFHLNILWVTLFTNELESVYLSAVKWFQELDKQ